MKLEVNFVVEEITRYRVMRKYSFDGPDHNSVGFDCGNQCGEFETRRDAEKVRDALEASAGRQALAAV